MSMTASSSLVEPVTLGGLDLDLLTGLMTPLVVLVFGGFVAARREPRRVWHTAVALFVLSTATWLAVVGLYPHEDPCGHGPRCPTAYGYDAPLSSEHGAGAWLLLAGFAVPAVWVGWLRLAPALTTGAALAVGPTALAWWTAPRGDNDGLWVLVFWYLPMLGASAAVVCAVVRFVGVALRPRV